MLNLLFDIAKQVSLRPVDDCDLFITVMDIAASYLALDLDITGKCNTFISFKIHVHKFGQERNDRVHTINSSK